MTEWGEEDRAEIRRLTQRELDEVPGVSYQTAISRAYKSHFARTGRVPSHGFRGYQCGCRCTKCVIAKSVSNRADYRRRKKKP